jgi:arylsulfatase A-like enzyme
MPPPNILYIMPDQWRGMDLGFLGDSPVRTPNLDKLARRGVVFTSAVANTPVCTAARASLLTGQYAHSVGMAVNDLPLDTNVNGIAKMLSKAGYYTGMIGKWHLEGGPRMPGYVTPTRRQGYEFWAGSICNHDYFRQVYFRDDPSPIRMEEYETFGWTKLAFEFLDLAQQRKQPWFLCMHQGPPHDPYLFPPGFERSYDPAKIPLRPNWRDGAVTANGRPTGTREQIAVYYAAIECLDQEIGKVVDRVDMANTVVLFFSDHGDMLGSQQMALKRKPWEESCLVPMIFAGAGIPAGRRTPQPISHIDIVPTLLGVAGLKKTAEMPGFDFSGLLRSSSTESPNGAPKHSMLMSQGRTEGGQFPPWRGLRTPEWKYARFEDRPWVLYNLKEDRYEQHNLVEDSGFTKLVAGFDAEIAAWQRQFSDSWTEQVDWLLRKR